MLMIYIFYVELLKISNKYGLLCVSDKYTRHEINISNFISLLIFLLNATCLNFSLDYKSGKGILRFPMVSCT